MDLDEEELLHSQLRTKGKSQTYLIRPNILELKPRLHRQGKCLGAALEVLEAEQLYRLEMELSQKPKEYNYISNDIWFHLANYIPPEDIKRYALICTQSAYSIRSRRFWLHIYQKYCQQSKDKKKWILELPDHLQMIQLIACDVHTLRYRVIQALFYCHIPYTESLKEDYKLETLVGRSYVSCWHLQAGCVWIMCYKFRLNFPGRDNSDNTTSPTTSVPNKEDDHMEVVHDWESLADENNNNNVVVKSSTSSWSRITQLAQEDYDGVSLLIICCNRFIPFPSDFLYANSSSSIRLAATRELLSTDMRSKNLEIDFVSLRGGLAVTWKYNQVLKLNVFPWWHPNFSKFNKCE